jgi:acyl carrier protein
MTVTEQDVVDRIVGFVRRRFPGETGAGAETRLLEGNSIDSLGLIELMTFLTESYGVDITDEDFSEENFQTIGSVARLVGRKLA